MHTMLRCLLSYLLVPLSTSVPNLLTPTPTRVTGDRAIAFEMRAGFLVVIDGQIGSATGLKFIVDTGASHSMIDQGLADRLRLQRRTGEVTSFDRRIPVEWANSHDVRIGPMQADSLEVMVTKLSDYSDLARNVDGIVGLDLLSKNGKFAIDYEGRTICFRPADQSGPAHRTRAYFATQLFVQGVPLHLVLDTGFQGILLYENRLRRIPTIHIDGAATRFRMGRLRGRLMLLPGVEIAGEKRQRPVFLLDENDEDLLPGVDGVLGIAALHSKCVEFDFDSSLLRLE